MLSHISRRTRKKKNPLMQSDWSLSLVYLTLMQWPNTKIRPTLLVNFFRMSSSWLLTGVPNQIFFVVMMALVYLSIGRLSFSLLCIFFFIELWTCSSLYLLSTWMIIFWTRAWWVRCRGVNLVKMSWCTH